MKRLMPILLAVLLLTGCGNAPEPHTNETVPAPAETTAAETPASAETEASTQATTAALQTAEAAETTADASSASGYSAEDLQKLAEIYYGTRHNHVPEFIETDTEADGTVVLHLYDIFDGHSATCAWYYIDPRTGKGHDLLEEPVDLTETPAEVWNPDIPQHEQLFQTGDFCGVVDLGMVSPGSFYSPVNVEYRELFLQSGALDLFPFLADIPEVNFAGTQDGTNLFLVIPASADARVVVSEYVGGEDREIGPIYRSYNGAPFLLRCNVGDLWNNTRIHITDANGEHEPFSILFSGRDGSLEFDADHVAAM